MDANGLCEGCSRTLPEIAAWGSMSDADKRRVWRELPARRAQRLRVRADTKGAPMKVLQFWFDPISPYAYLAFEHLPRALEGCSHVVEYRPLLFAGLLGRWGQKGPAEIEPKRVWTYRQVAWTAHHLGVPMALPSQHPFNPLPLLRLALASAPAAGLPNRRVVELLMHHVWRGGADASDPARLRALAEAVAPQRDPAAAAVKAELRAHTDAAIERGVFGVPTVEVDGRLFWGLDALPMVRAAVLGEPWFEGPAWDAAAAAAPGVQRRG